LLKHATYFTLVSPNYHQGTRIMFDRLFHRIPWNGDRIRLYQRGAPPGEVFLGEHNVLMVNGNVKIGQGYIRGDLPKWSERFGCWEYYYDE
jgi:hypothetical protein